MTDPNWYLHGLNLDAGRLLFVKTSAQQLSAASFLDNRFEIKNLPTAEVGLQEIMQQSNDLTITPPRFVFHTAFCCSTLLARCLDLPGHCVALKEPEVLMTLANYQRTGHKLLANPRDAHALYRLITFLLFRPFAENQAVIVKPTNTVNNIIRQLMSTHVDSKALLLHSDLQSFLISTLKKGERGRGFARHLFNIFQMDSAEALQLPGKQLLGMTDLQIAAITWHLQLENFFAALEAFGPAQVSSLHCDRLLDNPEQTLQKVVSHLALTNLQENFAAMMEHAPLSSNAKTPGQDFTASDRQGEYQDTEMQFSESLQLIGQWAQQLRFKFAYSDKIANPL